MGRKTLIILITISSIILTALIVNILIVSTPERHLARIGRRNAVKSLLSRGGSLSKVITAVKEPYSPEGSLGALNHFLSKDPGRSAFPGSADRRRMNLYIDPLSGKIERYETTLYSDLAPDWKVSFMANNRALFEEVQQDLVDLCGIPSGIFNLPQGSQPGKSLMIQMEKAIADFAAGWIPVGATRLTYTPNRRELRDYLIGNRRFNRAKARMDSSLRVLISALYNLAGNPQWQLAQSMDPELQKELNELTIAVISADIYRRGWDLLSSVPVRESYADNRGNPGVTWIPEMSFYKNIPELTGYTDDEEPKIFIARLNIGYTFRDIRTQTWLNQHKDWLTDYFLWFFSRSKSADFIPVAPSDPSIALWKASRFKAEGIHTVNRKISLEYRFGSNKVFGVRDLALYRINLHENP